MARYDGSADTQSRQLKLLRVQTALIGGIFLLLLAALVFLAVQFAALGEALDMVETQLQSLELEETVEALTTAAETMGEVDMAALNEAVASLDAAAENLGAVDMKQLNSAVLALKGAATNLQDVDVEALNTLVSALETVATKLEGAVNALSNIGKIFN